MFEGTHIPVTISVGVAGMPDPAIKDASDIVAAADQVLYEAKRGGRNRVTVHSRLGQRPGRHVHGLRGDFAPDGCLHVGCSGS